jgi:hypothetical protein
LVDASDPNQGMTISSYASSVITSYQQELLRETNIPIRIIPEVRMLYNPEMRSAYNFVPGLMGMIFMLVCAMMTSVAIVREKESGTMEVLLASPVKPVYIVISKLVPYFIVVGIYSGSADNRKFGLVEYFYADFHCRSLVFGFIDIDCGQDAGGRYFGFGNGFDYAGYSAFGLCVSH